MKESYEVQMLRKEVHRLQVELDEERRLSSKAVDLMLRGESMREALMFKAICAGAFNSSVVGSEPKE